MLLSWMLYSLLVSALVAVAACAAERLARRARVPIRLVWGSAMVMTALLMAGAPFRSSATEFEPWRATNSREITAVEWRAEAAHITLPEPSLRTERSASEPANHSVIPIPAFVSPRTMYSRLPDVPSSVTRAVMVLWFSTSSLIFAIAIVVYARFAQLRRRWPKLVLADHSVRVSPNVGPVAMGVAPSEIVVPHVTLNTSGS